MSEEFIERNGKLYRVKAAVSASASVPAAPTPRPVEPTFRQGSPESAPKEKKRVASAGMFSRQG